MTIIVYKDGVVAADDLIWDDQVISGRMQKIRARSDGAILIGCGNVAGIQYFFRQAEKGRPGKATGEGINYSGAIIYSDGRVEEYDQTGLQVELSCDYYCTGAGRDIARGAVDAGADPAEAVRIVCSLLGWPADIHVMSFASPGELQVIKAELTIHENSRVKPSKPRKAGLFNRSRASGNRSKTRQVAGRKHKRRSSAMARCDLVDRA